MRRRLTEFPAVLPPNAFHMKLLHLCCILHCVVFRFRTFCLSCSVVLQPVRIFSPPQNRTEVGKTQPKTTFHLIVPIKGFAPSKKLPRIQALCFFYVEWHECFFSRNLMGSIAAMGPTQETPAGGSGSRCVRLRPSQTPGDSGTPVLLTQLVAGNQRSS